MMIKNINTKSYWDNRFASGDLENKNGRLQTRLFAESQVEHLNLSKDFEGTILDFGCGLGDAMPVYLKHFPKSKLIGIDHSAAAIDLCLKNYKDISSFICGNLDDIPNVDVIIASNVMEHISDDKKIISKMLSKCCELYIIVPYKENPLCSEHINYYDKNYYDQFKPSEVKVFYSKGWTEYGYNLFINVYLKNILRPVFGKPFSSRRKQIMFHIKGDK